LTADDQPVDNDCRRPTNSHPFTICIRATSVGSPTSAKINQSVLTIQSTPKTAYVTAMRIGDRVSDRRRVSTVCLLPSILFRNV
jgi:hypothetical protein